MRIPAPTDRSLRLAGAIGLSLLAVGLAPYPTDIVVGAAAGERWQRAVLNNLTGTYSGPGTQTGSLNLTGSVLSDCGTFPFPCPFPGDQAAVRFGALDPGTLDPGFTAGDYPGVGARVVANDGHFARFTLTPVPEPSTAALACLGLLALAFAGRSRRSRRSRRRARPPAA